MDLFTPQIDKCEVAAHSVLTLAHVGDGVFELMIRTKLAIEHAYTKEGMHKAVLRHVSATAQAQAFELIRARLTDEEMTVFKRGRNAHVHVPRSATPAAYHTSTGLETLFGWLWLMGQRERLNQLFSSMLNDANDDQNG